MILESLPIVSKQDKDKSEEKRGWEEQKTEKSRISSKPNDT